MGVERTFMVMIAISAVFEIIIGVHLIRLL